MEGIGASSDSEDVILNSFRPYMINKLFSRFEGQRVWAGNAVVTKFIASKKIECKSNARDIVVVLLPRRWPVFIAGCSLAACNTRVFNIA